MRPSTANIPNPVRGGITLLETMLALAITSVMIALIGMALSISLGTLDRARQETTAAQLAHTLLRQISHDLRSALPPPATPSTASTGIDSADFTATNSSVDAASDGASPSVSPVSSSHSNLMGNREELQWDRWDAPRPDEHATTLRDGATSTTGYSASGIKTVAYFMRGGTTNNGPARDSDAETGLMRRENDRATTQWAMARGQLTSSDDTVEPLASEVESLEFRYFDGGQWLDRWDTTISGRLPVLVEITIAMRNMDGRDPVPRGESGDHPRAPNESAQGDLVFRTVVPIAVVQAGEPRASPVGTNPGSGSHDGAAADGSENTASDTEPQ